MDVSVCRTAVRIDDGDLRCFRNGMGVDELFEWRGKLVAKTVRIDESLVVLAILRYHTWNVRRSSDNLLQSRRWRSGLM